MAVKVDGFGQTGADEIAQLYAGIEQTHHHVQRRWREVEQANLHHHVDEGKRNADEKHTNQAQSEIKQTRQGKHHCQQGIQSVEADVAVDFVVCCPASRDLPHHKTQAQNDQGNDPEVEGGVWVLVKPSDGVSPCGRRADEDAQTHAEQQPQARAFQHFEMCA